MLAGTAGRIGQFREETALFVPVRLGGDRANLSLCERGSAVGVGPQEDDFLLKVGSKAGEVENLGQTSAGDAAGSGQITLRLKSTGSEDAVEVDRKGHQAG